jgi:dihydrofolate reductase
MQAGLVDAYWLLVHPVLRGRGKRLFADGALAGLKLIESTAFRSGVVLLRYEPDRKAR